jgi:hypothetical protein
MRPSAMAEPMKIGAQRAQPRQRPLLVGAPASRL